MNVKEEFCKLFETELGANAIALVRVLYGENEAGKKRGEQGVHTEVNWGNQV